MSLLFLIGLGTANVKAQVRIGGDGAPNAAAVLDLNASDATTGTKGLALPRVDLTSNTMQLKSGTANLAGMLVYNTTATLGAGIYTWTGSAWKRVDAVPAATPADSGLFLMSTGNGVAFMRRFASIAGTASPVTLLPTPLTVTWRLVLYTSTTVSIPSNSSVYIDAPGISMNDHCIQTGWTGGKVVFWATNDRIWAYEATGGELNGSIITFRCYRPTT